jgi:hypothetical protein
VGRLDVVRLDAEHRLDRLDVEHREVEWRVGRHHPQDVEARSDRVMVEELLFRWPRRQEGVVPQVQAGEVAGVLVEDQLQRQK